MRKTHKCEYCNEPSPKPLRLRRDWLDKPGVKARMCDACHDIMLSEHRNPAMTQEEYVRKVLLKGCRIRVI